MGKPAARVGDMTAHGGAITGPGVPTVLIGGMPAATLGDMHVCPMATPGTPPIPHVGGPISIGSTGVLIGKKPAARMGDMAICVGPPSTIVMGCPTVLIGEVGSGSGGGGGGAGAGGGGGSAASGALTSASIAGEAPPESEIESHFIDFIFEDEAKLAVGGVRYTLSYPNNRKAYGFLGRQIKRNGVPEGNYNVELHSIVDAQWSKKSADVGEEVELRVETMGIKDGSKATFEIYVRDSNYIDHLLDVKEATVNGDRAVARWKMEVDEKYLNICNSKSKNRRYSTPFFFFKVSIGGLLERSGLLYLKDWVEIELYDKENKPVSGERFTVTVGDGKVIEDKLESNGKKKVEGISPANIIIEFPERDDV